MPGPMPPVTTGPVPQPPMPPPRVPSAGPTAPAAANATPQGTKAQGLIRAGIAVKFLEQTIPMIGAASEEGQAILKALTLLSKIVPQPNADLGGAEMKFLNAKAPGASPMNPAGTQAQMMDRLKGLGLGAKPPGVAA